MKRAVCVLLVVLFAAGCADDGGDAAPGNDADDGGAAGAWYRPTAATTWQWQLRGDLDTSVDAAVYDVDLFDTSEQTIETLQNDGRRVICYFSAGSSENWRDDFPRYRAADLGADLDGWEGERWVDIRSENVRAILEARLDLAVDKGCDGVEPDNVDGYDNDPGFPLTRQDQLDFDRWLATEAHARGLSVGLKNALDLIPDLVADFDFAVNEQCHEYDECAANQPFLDADEPVWNAEYAADETAARALAATICPDARASGLRTLILPLELDGSFRVSCDDE